MQATNSTIDAGNGKLWQPPNTGNSVIPKLRQSERKIQTANLGGFQQCELDKNV